MRSSRSRRKARKGFGAELPIGAAMLPAVPAAAASPEAYVGLALVVLGAFAFASSTWTLARRALRLSLWAASGAILSLAVSLLAQA